MGKYDWVVMPDEKKTTLLQTIPTTPSQAKAGKYDWIPTRTDVKTPETALGIEGEKRKIDAGFIKEYFPALNENLYFVVGPPPMVEAVQKALLEAGVDISNINIENFTGY